MKRADPLELLRLEVWRSRRRRVKLMGRVYLTGGFGLLAAGYFSGYLGLELVSAVMLALGVFFTFSGNEPYMKSTLASLSVVSTLRVLQEALNNNSGKGHTVFLPVEAPGVGARMYLHSEGKSWSSSSREVGRPFTPLGHELFKAFLEELGGKTESELIPLLDQLRRVMTSLELAQDVKFSVDGNTVDVKLTSVAFVEIGRYPDLAKGIYEKVGCPVTNSIGEWIASGMKREVTWLGARCDPLTRNASVRLSLGSAGSP